ncbi:hypothetical protein [Bradyrhizobium sp. LHD-71]|uniref:hypothetical protein n=1 Tax=Bradyrhizobium sp. LHD-71 TaxID=3072141 RepID=UPI00280CD3BC|nr:hypothetical protein [Bradyrhizobium sp. LHD-71]MDQ8732432.1 hypothetical protein [Bradyrhizobium sp. LHD-71]
MTDRRDQEPDRPHLEPEIIPPGRQERDSGHVFISIDENGDARRVYIARPGPLTIIVALAVLVLIGLLLLIVLLSVALIWIPVAIALLAAVVAVATFRHWWHRLQNWWARR